MSQFLGSFYAIASGISYGSMGFFGVKLKLLGHSVYNMLALRFGISFLGLLILQIIYLKQYPASNHEAARSFFSGCLLYSGCSISYFLASNTIGSGLSMVVFFCYPLIIVLVRQFYDSVPCDRATAYMIILIMVGMFFLSDPKVSSFSPIGLSMAILSAIFYAAYILFSKHIDLHPITNTLYVSLGATVSCSLIALYTHTGHWPVFSEEWGYLLGIGLLSTALPIILFLESLRYISMEKASILSVLEPLCVLLVGVFILDEPVSICQLFGTGLMLTGSFIALYQPSRLPIS